jgi:RHS repeat-associated protein
MNWFNKLSLAQYVLQKNFDNTASCWKGTGVSLALFLSIFSYNVSSMGVTYMDDDEGAVIGSQGRIDQVSNNYRELFNLEHEVTPYTSKLFGEQIGLSTGSLSFKQTDFSIPGNSPLLVNATRVFVSADSLDSNTRDFGSWGLDLPHIRSNIMTLDGEVNFKGSWGTGVACSGELGDGGDWSPYVDNSLVPERGQSVWNGDNIYIPGKSSQKILSTIEGGKEVKVTNQHWKIDCYTTDNGYEGFKVITTDGTEYTFGQLKLIKGKDFRILQTKTHRRLPSPKFRTYHAFMLPTEIEDKFGNKVIYHYGVDSRIENITATSIDGADGRNVSIKYYEPNVEAEQEFANHIKTISVNDRVWTYLYKNKGNVLGFGRLNTLSKVIRPDGKSWVFDHPDTSEWKKTFVGRHELIIPPEEKSSDWRQCEHSGSSGEYVTMTHPEGLKATFSYAEQSLKRFNVDWHLVSARYTAKWGSPTWPENKPCTLVYSLKRKVITRINQQKETWIYNYKQPYKGYWETSSGNEPFQSAYHQVLGLDLPYDLTVNDLRTTEVTAPDGSKIAHHISGKWGWTENTEIFTDYYDKDGITLLRRVGNISEKSPLRGDSKVNNDFTSAFFMRTRLNNDSYYYSDGNDIYTTEYSNFNLFDAPRKISQIGGTHHRYITKTFKHDFDNWVVNLPELIRVGNTEVGVKQVSKKDYSTFSTTGNVLLPSKTYGRSELLTEIKSYHSFGKVNKIEFNSRMSQGQTGNTYQKLSTYKRGKATTIYLPNRYKAGEMSMSRVIDNNGWVTSVTNLNKQTTTYSYDYLGRLASIDYPEARFEDAVFVWSENTGYPVRTEKRCQLNASKDDCANQPVLSKDSTYDGFLRPVEVKTTDHNTNISQYQNFDYNIDGQVTTKSFASYTPGESAGITYMYDGLQRNVNTEFYGGGIVRRSYLKGNHLSVTDAENNVTNTRYMAFSEPSYNQPLTIASPERVVTTLAVDVFGNINSITQSGFNGHTAVQQTEYRAYDNQGNLCQISRNDVGTTVFYRNSVGEVQWKANGQIAPYNTVCNTTASAKSKVSFQYDNLGEKYMVSYGDGMTPSRFTLDNNGNLKKTSGAGFSQAYNYNSMNLLEDETLTIDGKILSLDYGYNNLFHLSSLKYPDGSTKVSFAPNSFGQATQAARTKADGGIDTFVKVGASYYPNGMLDSFTYGNDINHKTTLNNRMQPQKITDVFATSDIVNLSYTYDNNNNITKIINTRDGGMYNLNSLSYDGLDRLTATDGSFGSGDSTLSYDGLGNIRTYVNKSNFDNHNFTYQYDSRNRLTAVNGSDRNAFGYDASGNVTNNGKRSFDYNLLNQMKSSGSSQFVYDGYNRRIKSIKDNKDTEYSMYSQSGKLLYRETKEGAINYIFLGSRLVAKEGTGVVSSNSVKNYKPFGDAQEDSSDDVGYTGHLFDTDLDLNYMQARYYDPVIGRFYSNDPIGFRDVHSFNRYSYGNNNPYKYTDPTGMASDCLLCKNPQYPTNGTPTRQTAEGKMAEQSGANNTSEFKNTTTGEVVSEVGGKLPGTGGLITAVAGAIIQGIEGADVTPTASGIINGAVAATITEDVITDSGKNASNPKTKIVSTVVGVVVGAISSANEKTNSTKQNEQKQLEKREVE